MDFIISLPETENGYNAVMVIVDRITKRAKFIATRTTDAAAEIATAFMENYVKDHGMPKTIVPIETPSSHPSYGKQLCVVNPAQNDWDDYLHLTEIAYNRHPEFHKLEKADQEFLLRQETLLNVAQDHMSEAQERMKHYYDKNRLVQDFEVGNMVLLDVRMVEEIKAASGVPYLTPKAIPQKVNKVVLADGSEGQLVEAVIGHRKYKGKPQYKIWWLGESKKDATWEPVDNLKQIPGLIDLYWKSKKGRKPYFE
ncbi:Hypothetical protein PHPALM_21081 [Phytophthora palmivora]|uniref:Chromo domain-containing protein n=1 Tax=Phytophthora palmivora TaxID=4796 RepID=A0A2P4XD84_9STRA|nr:Hypothetical protein PHPALM_21081 [Phytophthora palmivora]